MKNDLMNILINYQVAVGTGKPLYDVSSTNSSPFFKLIAGSNALNNTGGAI